MVVYLRFAIGRRVVPLANTRPPDAARRFLVGVKVEYERAHDDEHDANALTIVTDSPSATAASRSVATGPIVRITPMRLGPML